MNPEDKEPKSSTMKSLRTYQGDIDEILSKGKESASTILIAEQKRKEEKPEVFAPTPKNTPGKNKFYIVLGISLLVLGGITVSGVYYLKSKEEVKIIQQTKALIAFTKETTLPLAGLTEKTIVSSILREKESFKMPLNSVLFINTVSNDGINEIAAPIEKVFSLLAPKMPSSLLRSFGEKYMLGVYSFDTNGPFIIITLEDYASAYAGMLRWEKDMTQDLGELFQIPQNASSTSYTFIDEAMKNKDLRVLKDENKKTILLYSFLDRETLLITTNENIFNAIVGKHLINKSVK